MPSYSPDLRITLIDSGTQAGTWGNTTNDTLQYVVDPAISGFQTVSVISADQALTYVNGATSTAGLNQAIYALLAFTTTTTAAFNVYAPPNSKQYVLWNNSSYTMTIYNSTVIGNTTAAGVGVTIAAGKKVQVFSDGTNFYTLNINEIFAPFGVLYADSTGAVTSTPSSFAYNNTNYILDVAADAGYNSQAFIRVAHSTAGTGKAAVFLAQADKAQANIRAFSSTNSSTLGVNQTLFYGSGTGAGGTVLADFSSGAGSTNQIRFLVGTTSVPVTAATVNSTGNWDFNGKALTAGNLAVTGATLPTNGLYLYTSNVLGFSVNSTVAGTATLNIFDWGDPTNPVNSGRTVRAYNNSNGASASATVSARADAAIAQMSSFSSAHATLPGRSYIYGSGTGANGTFFADYSTGTNQMVFQVGTAASPITAATVNSTGIWTYPIKPSFYTYLSTTQTNVLGTTATNYTVPFDVELFDRTNNVSGGTFTAPVTGVYRFSAQVVVSDLGSAGSASTGIIGKLVTTSQTYTLTYATPTGPAGTNYFGSFQTVGGSVTVSMTAGDTAYIAVQAVGSTGDLADVRGNASNFYTWFSGELVA